MSLVLYNPARSKNALRDRWDEMPHEHRVAVVIGGTIASVLALGGIAAAIVHHHRKAPPSQPSLINASAACSSPTVTDAFKWAEMIRNRVRTAAQRGDVDPFVITSDVIRSQTSICTVYPNNTQNPGQAKFYAQTFMAVIQAMSAQNLVSAQQASTWNSMMFTWASGQGVNLSEL
jgi:hypothetical protein